MLTKEKIIENLNAVRVKSPLIHNITNYVVMNNTANALLSVGASPVMAHALEEVKDMVNIASSLVINMGTLSPEWVKAMIKAGEKANSLNKPIVFDPVGVGATNYRTEVANTIITICKPHVIRGNASEIMALVKSNTETKGVDSTVESNTALASAKILAKEKNCIVVISGQTDYITDGSQVICIKNGSTMMAKVTGMGCTASAIVGAFVAIESNMLIAASSAMAIMGIAGQITEPQSKGNGSFQINFLDNLHNLSNKEITKYYIEQ